MNDGIEDLKRRLSNLGKPSKESELKPFSAVIEEVEIDTIIIADKFRKDLGDIASFAKNIERLGLLQPIGITPDKRLICGCRRLAAYTYLKRRTIPARILDVKSIIQAEEAENNARKDFSRAERIAIANAIRKEMGDRNGRRDCSMVGRTEEIAAIKAGFSSRDDLRRSELVLKRGSPTLIQAMEAGTVSVSAAAILSGLPMSEQDNAIATKNVINVVKQMQQKRARRILVPTMILGGLSVNISIDLSKKQDLEFAMQMIKSEIELALSKQ